MNNCVFIARLGQDPEVKQAGETTVVNFSGAVRRKFTKDGQPDTDWLNFVAFGKTADFVGKYFNKGSQIAVVAHVQVDNYTDKDGNKRTATKFIVDQVDFVGSKGDSAQSNAGVAPKSNNSDGFVAVDNFDDDDLPF